MITQSWAVPTLGWDLGLKVLHGVGLLSLPQPGLKTISGIQHWKLIPVSSLLCQGSFNRGTAVRSAPYSSLAPLNATRQLCLQSPVYITGASTGSCFICCPAELSPLTFSTWMQQWVISGQISSLCPFTQVLLPDAGCHCCIRARSFGEGCIFWCTWQTVKKLIMVMAAAMTAQIFS